MNDTIDRFRDAPAVAMNTIRPWFENGACEADLTSHDYRQYVLIHTGRGLVTLDNKTQPIGPGSLALVPSGAVFKLRMNPGAQGMIMAANEEFVRSKVLATLEVPTGIYWNTYHMPMLFHRWAGPQNRATRQRVWRELEGARARLGPHYDCAVAAYVIIVLCSYLSIDPNVRDDAVQEELLEEARRNGDRAHMPAETAQAELVMRFRTLVENNFRQQWSIKTSCQAMGVTEARLTRACNAVLGRTPLAIMHERILLEAKRELLYSAHSVSQISYGLGFAEPGYFCRFFKHHAGQSPMEFRRKNKSAGVRVHAA